MSSRLLLKASPPRKILAQVGDRVEVSRRGHAAKASSRDALLQFRYQKYWAISTAPGSTGEAKFHCLKMESTTCDPVTMSFTQAVQVWVLKFFSSRSSLPKNLSKFSWPLPANNAHHGGLFHGMRKAIAASRASTKAQAAAGHRTYLACQQNRAPPWSNSDAHHQDQGAA